MDWLASALSAANAQTTAEYLVSFLDFETEEERHDAILDTLLAVGATEDDAARLTREILARKAELLTPAPVPAPAAAPAQPLTMPQPNSSSSRASEAAAPKKRINYTRLADFDLSGTDDGGDVYDDDRSARPVCRHFLEGACMRADCWFSHDTARVPCRFWLAGFCVKGAACPFAHSVDDGDTGAAAGAVDTQLLEDLSEWDEAVAAADAADAAAAVELAAPPAAAPPVYFDGAAQTFAMAVRVGQLRERFPWVEEFVVRDVLSACGGDSAAATARLRSDFPRPQTTSAAPGKPSASAAAAAAAASSSTASPMPSPRAQPDSADLRRMPVSATPHQMLWVETGATVAQQYKTLRAQAFEHAELRNKLFQQSTAAYLRGDGKTARALSEQGRFHQAQMDLLNQEASQRLFQQRNRELNVGSDPVYDLHGLHVSEALEFIEERMEELRAKRFAGSLYLIVGTGHHSASTKSRLGPAITSFLWQQYHVKPVDVSTDKRGGMLRVKVPKA